MSMELGMEQWYEYSCNPREASGLFKGNNVDANRRDHRERPRWAAG
jgi:hypothetical protein